MISVPKTIATHISKAALKAMPTLLEKIQVTADRNKDWDYTCPSAIKIYNMSKKTGSFGFATCQDLAQAIVTNLDEEAHQVISGVEIKQIGAGDPAKSGFFLNVQLKDAFIEDQINKLLRTEKLEILKDEDFKQQRVIVDFSSPNIAKDMHVGHLRSTIIGDAICRVLEFLGHDVLRVNHLGDWGTQFGMLIAELNDEFPDFLLNPPPIADLVVFYKRSKQRFDLEPDFKKTAHENVVKLQQGDVRTFQAWQLLCSISEKEFQRIYDRLQIRITNRGESFYNPLIKPMIEDLTTRGLLTESDGAKCVFVPKRKVPLMVQKTDGGYGYDTTDLAAIRYRTQEQEASWVVYVTDLGQQLHFDTVIDGAKMVGYMDPAKTRYDHVGFGLVLQVMAGEEGKTPEAKPAAPTEKKGGKKGAGAAAKTEVVPAAKTEKVPVKTEEAPVVKTEEAPVDKSEPAVQGEAKPKEKKAGAGEEAKKPKIGKMKTREGDTTKLMDLLDEAKNRTLAGFRDRLKEFEGDQVASQKTQLDESEMEKTAEILGISSVKYYDLKQNRTQDYIFAFDKMLDPRGNTGIYLLYQYVRILSIMRKASFDEENLAKLIADDSVRFTITNKSERELALALLRLPEQIDIAMTDLMLNRLTDQLYEISVKVGEFYQQSKVIGSAEQNSRILLLETTRKIMKLLFDILGMRTIDRI